MKSIDKDLFKIEELEPRLELAEWSEDSTNEGCVDNSCSNSTCTDDGCSQNHTCDDK